LNIAAETEIIQAFLQRQAQMQKRNILAQQSLAASITSETEERNGTPSNMT